jgi:hypothetical protein
MLRVGGPPGTAAAAEFRTVREVSIRWLSALAAEDLNRLSSFPGFPPVLLMPRGPLWRAMPSCGQVSYPIGVRTTSLTKLWSVNRGVLSRSYKTEVLD